MRIAAYLLATLALLAGCEGRGTLVVQVRTDLVPVRQLGSVRVTGARVGGAALPESTRAAAASDGWAAGVRVAELAALEPGTYRLDVAALAADGAVLVARPVRAEVASGLTVVTVLLTRDCLGVACPAPAGDPAAIACLAGRCVTEECVEEATPEACGAAQCATAADCAASLAPCASVECAGSGSCFTALDHASCGAGRVCDPDAGCVDAAVPAFSVTNGGLALDEGGLATIARAELRAEAAGFAPEDIAFTVPAAPAEGRLELGGAPCDPCAFTQRDLDDGRVAYRHLGGEAPADSFPFEVATGGTPRYVGDFAITVRPINDPPANRVARAVGGPPGFPFVFQAGSLSVDDPDAAGRELEVDLALSPATATLRLRSTRAAVVAGADGTDHVRLRGIQATLGESLTDLRIDPPSAAPEIVTLTMTTDDLGNAGAGGPLTDTDVVSIDFSTEHPIARDDGELYADVVSELGPIGWWRLGESVGGLAMDSSSHLNHGAHASTLRTGQPGATPDGDLALGLDGGARSYVAIPHHPSYATDEGTIQVWVRADAVPAGDQIAVSKDATGEGNGGHFVLGLAGGGRPTFLLGSTTAVFGVIGPAPVVAGRWHQLTATFGPSGLALFVDGVEVGRDPYAGGLGPSSGGSGNAELLVLGADTRFANPGTSEPAFNAFVGELDEVLFFDRALDACTTRRLFWAAKRARFSTDFIGLDLPASEGVLANDCDPQGDPLIANHLDGPLGAESFVLFDDGSFTYVPRAGFSGMDSFRYQAMDGTRRSNLVTVHLSVF